MRRRTWVLLTAATMMWGAVPRVPRSALTTVERYLDRRMETFDINDPLDVLGMTRGVYIDGYGVVFTSEVGLVATPNITPFRLNISLEDIAKLRKRKVDRVPQVKRLMRDMLVHSGTALSAIPMEEQVMVSMILFYAQWEDKNGLPSEIRMQAQRKALVDFEAGRINAMALDAAIRVQEN